MKKELDLSGLKQVIAGLVIQLISAFLIGSLTSGMMSGRTASGILSCVIHAAGIVLILIGLSRLGDASPFFIKARKYFLIQLILQAVLAVILVFLGRSGWTVDSIRQMARNSILELLFLFIIWLAVWVVSMLFSVRTVLRGCGHVAEQTNDPLFSVKCIKTWRLWYMAFLLTILMMMAGLAVIVTVLRKTIENGAAGQDLTQAIFTNVASSVLLVSVIGMAALVFLLVAQILYVAKVRTTYREYHLEEVVVPEAGAARPVFADYVQRELQSAGDPSGAFPEDPEPEENKLPEADEEEERSEDPEEDMYAEEDPEPGETDLQDDGTGQVRKLYSGRKYRRVIQEPEEEEEPDTDQILEIARLFRKKGNE